MKQELHQPMTIYSERDASDQENVKQHYYRVITFMAISYMLSFLFIMINWKYWPLTIFLFLVALIFTGLASELHPQALGGAYKVRFELNEKGLFEKERNVRKNDRERVNIPFSSMQRVLVGNFSKYEKESRTKGNYRLGVLVIIFYEEGLFFKPFFDGEAFQDLIARLYDQKIPLYRAEEDLYWAYLDRYKLNIDFTTLKAFLDITHYYLLHRSESKTSSRLGALFYGMQRLSIKPAFVGRRKKCCI